jgi:hypothetical protein
MPRPLHSLLAAAALLIARPSAPAQGITIDVPRDGRTFNSWLPCRLSGDWYDRHQNGYTLVDSYVEVWDLGENCLARSTPALMGGFDFGPIWHAEINFPAEPVEAMWYTFVVSNLWYKADTDRWLEDWDVATARYEVFVHIDP